MHLKIVSLSFISRPFFHLSSLLSSLRSSFPFLRFLPFLSSQRACPHWEENQGFPKEISYIFNPVRTRSHRHSFISKCPPLALGCEQSLHQLTILHCRERCHRSDSAEKLAAIDELRTRKEALSDFPESCLQARELQEGIQRKKRELADLTDRIDGTRGMNLWDEPRVAKEERLRGDIVIFSDLNSVILRIFPLVTMLSQTCLPHAFVDDKLLY